MSGIFVEVDDKSGTPIAATAEAGRFLATDDPDTILFRLHNGRLIQESPKFSTPRTLAFDSYDLPINLPAVDRFRQRGDDSEELTLPEVVAPRLWRRLTSNRDDELAAQANLHFRLVEVVMMLMLPLLAVALAVPPKRSTSSLGIFIAIVMVVTYHKINQYAEQAGAQGRIDPMSPCGCRSSVFAALIVWMYHVLAYHPGGQPIGALERGFAKIGKSRSARCCRRQAVAGVINLQFLPLAPDRALHGQAVPDAQPGGAGRCWCWC